MPILFVSVGVALVAPFFHTQGGVMAYQIRCERCGVVLVEDRWWQVTEVWRAHWQQAHPEFKAHRASVEEVTGGEK